MMMSNGVNGEHKFHVEQSLDLLILVYLYMMIQLLQHAFDSGPVQA